MMRSLFSGVTGLRTHQTKMDVIGNNISNVNTEGFKRSSTTFADLYSETVSPSSGASAATGGINAKQIGLGAAMNSVVINHTPGAASYTGKPLDLAIPGDGFFILRTPDGPRYTRNGSLEVAGNGQLQTVSGNYAVQCYNSIYQQGTAGEVTTVGLTGKTTSYFDSFAFTPSATLENAPAGSYTMSIQSVETPPAGSGVHAATATVYRNGIQIATGLPINKSGGAGTPGELTDALTGAFEPSATYTVNVPDGLSPSIGQFTFGIKASLAPTEMPDFATAITDAKGVVDNMSLEVTNNDGFAAGNSLGDLIIEKDLYSNVSINEQGAVIAQLNREMVPQSNGVEINGAGTMGKGERVILGYVALATFTNNEGLEKIGTNLYQASPNSGAANIRLPGTEGASKLSPSSLEMSNVDLSQEMVNMITTQRGFQANSRIITTSDTMLEELVNLKR